MSWKIVPSADIVKNRQTGAIGIMDGENNVVPLASSDDVCNTKKFELIEEIIIDSKDVTVIERTQEPNGTGYSFEEVLINFEMEASTTSAALTCSANSIVSVGISKLVDTEKKYCTLQYQTYRGVLFTSYQSPVTNKTWAGNAIARNADVIFAEAINSLKFGCNTPIPLGSKITIYAVRK